MTKHDHVYIPFLVDTFQLALYPRKLLLIARNVRIETDDKRVPIGKRKHWVPREPVGRTIRRNQRRYRVQVVLKWLLAIRSVHRRGMRNVMIAGREKVGDATLRRQAIDQGRETDIPFFGILSALNGVA